MSDQEKKANFSDWDAFNKMVKRSSEEHFKDLCEGQFGAMTIRITPQGIVLLSVDGEAVGLIQHFKLKTPRKNNPCFTVRGEVEIAPYPGNEKHIDLLQRVPWLKVTLLRVQHLKDRQAESLQAARGLKTSGEGT